MNHLRYLFSSHWGIARR